MHEQIDLFKSLFRCREDVFALRWEKGNKSGYMPAYFFDRYRYRAHKMKGGNFQNYTDKTYLPLTDVIEVIVLAPEVLSVLHLQYLFFLFFTDR